MRSIAWRVTIRGRVQGVGYRYAMVDAANALGVTGWVRNRRDGTVEALVQGDAGAVERIVAWCRRGPAAAHVTAVATLAVDPDPALDAFQCWRTE
jgi:acylphosphatase